MLLVLTLACAIGTGRASVASLDAGHGEAEAWRLEQALDIARQLLRDHPDDPNVWFLAARVQHMRGEHGSALTLVRAAAAAGIDHVDELRQRIAGSEAFAANFATLETPHFRIRYLGKDEIVAVYAQAVLEGAYTNIAGDLEFLPAEGAEKIVVEIYPTARGLADATGLSVGDIETSGTIAVCKFHRLMIISPLAAANGYGWAETLAHEFTHLVISKKSRNTIPIWLHEGIAKFYESRWNGQLGENLSPYAEKLLATAVRKNTFITFAQMHPSMAKLPSQEDAALAFAEVFTVLEFLTKRYGKQGIPQVLALTAAGVRVEKALERVFGMGLAKIEKNWKQYLKKRPFRSRSGATPKRIVLTGAADTQHTEETPLEAIRERDIHNFARLGELLQLQKHDRAAVIEYEAALALGGKQYPTLVNRLARAYGQVDRKKDALALLDEVLQDDASNSDGHLLAGRLCLEERQLDRAEAHFRAAAWQNPFNPEIHAALSSLYKRRGATQKAAQEERFLFLSRTPRPLVNATPIPPPPGDATVSIVAPLWHDVRVDGGEVLSTPRWRWPVTSGEHMLEYLDVQHAPQTRRFVAPAAEDTLLLLD